MACVKPKLQVQAASPFRGDVHFSKQWHITVIMLGCFPFFEQKYVHCSFRMCFSGIVFCLGLFPFSLLAQVGFLHTLGTTDVDSNNQRIILRGVNLGNWLWPEYYMMGNPSVRPDQSILAIDSHQLQPLQHNQSGDSCCLVAGHKHRNETKRFVKRTRSDCQPGTIFSVKITLNSKAHRLAFRENVILATPPARTPHIFQSSRHKRAQPWDSGESRCPELAL
jgi:hypothetical protein